MSLVLVLVFDTLGIAAIAKLVNFGALTSFAVLHLTVIWMIIGVIYFLVVTKVLRRNISLDI